MPLPEETGIKFTYSHYLTWPGDERWELIDGEAYNMTPAPTFTHQKVVGNLYFTIKNKLAERRCTPGIAPTDVIFSEYDVVQPDVFVVCDEKKITEANIQGAPDRTINPFPENVLFFGTILSMDGIWHLFADISPEKSYRLDGICSEILCFQEWRFDPVF